MWERGEGWLVVHIEHKPMRAAEMSEGEVHDRTAPSVLQLFSEHLERVQSLAVFMACSRKGGRGGRGLRGGGVGVWIVIRCSLI